MSHLQQNIVSEHTQIELSCEKCENKTTDNELYTNQVGFSHEEPVPHVCDVCEDTFSSRSDLDGHIAEHKKFQPTLSIPKLQNKPANRGESEPQLC